MASMVKRHQEQETDDFDEEGLLGDLEEGAPSEPAKKGPGRVFLAIMLGLLIILMVVPFYSIKADPEPKGIPTLSEAIVGLDIQPANHGKVEYADFPLLAKQASDDQVVKTVADRIASHSCRSGETVCQAKAMFYFVRDKFSYVADPASFDYIKTARESLMSQGGDCDDASLLLASLLSSVGTRSRFIFIPGHVYVQAYLPEAIARYKDADGWVNLDATCQGCGFGETPYSTLDARKTVVG